MRRVQAVYQTKCEFEASKQTRHLKLCRTLGWEEILPLDVRAFYQFKIEQGALLIMRWKNGISAIALCILFAASAAAQPQATAQTPNSRPENMERRHGRGEHAGAEMGFMRHALRELNLTDAQRQQVHSIVERFMTSTKAQRDELRQLHEQRGQNGTFTPEQQERARQLHQQMMEANKSMNDEIIATLTPEQRTQLDQIRENFRARREERRERRRGGQLPPQ
ncbi:MAG: hypothetical protein AUG51_13285 [Acidobacteria bacterium 13_1_20CM_3_53_8]|nr:MAG: hypothetical protein AUG51_13285 [Acidobacteria bacterium 13_1_20CM_3_53_8]